MSQADFNSRPSARGDSASCREDTPPAISIHAPPRGATNRQAGEGNSKEFQFTPLREGRHAGAVVLRQRRDISIHAPPRGATNGCPVRDKHQFNFNSRPSARGDAGRGIVLMGVFHFNSRPSARGDSYHSSFVLFSTIFQFTPLREGRRNPGMHTSSFCTLFQFTPLREGRLGAGRPDCGEGGHFNSRPSARGDWAGCSFVRWIHISIHAPPRGATPTSPWVRRRWTFQFTPLREGRRLVYAINNMGELFQFTPLREGRPVSRKLNAHTE